MKIELLYFAGCPNHEAFMPRLLTLLDRAGVDKEVRLVHVESEDEARAVGFLGSPSLRVNGRDVEAGAADRSDFGLKCRLYQTHDYYFTPSAEEDLPGPAGADAGAEADEPVYVEDADDAEENPLL